MDIEIKAQNGVYTLQSGSEWGQAWLEQHFGAADPIELNADRSWVVAGCALSEGLRIE